MKIEGLLHVKKLLTFMTFTTLFFILIFGGLLGVMNFTTVFSKLSKTEMNQYNLIFCSILFVLSVCFWLSRLITNYINEKIKAM